MNNSFPAFRDLWNRKPLLIILLLGLLIRMVSVIFSKGFGWHDDHFLVIEAAQSWVDHYDYNNWLPSSPLHQPSGHSFFYVGIHYFLLYGLQSLGIHDPQVKMFFIRLLHALYSLLIIYFGYKIVLRLSDEKTAKTAGLILAFLWFMPFMSVRNLVELVSVVPVLAGTWMLLKEEKISLKKMLFVGLLFGIAFSIRFQSALFAAGTGLALLLTKRYRDMVVFGAGYVLCIALIQGIIDLCLWGRPFVEFGEYVRYNIANASEYGGMPWYNYLYLIFGILIPPISFFLVFGYFKVFRKHLLLTLPTAIFLLFHFYFQNRQERFIVPAFPFLIIAGCIGWKEFTEASSFWKMRPKLLKACWIFAVTLNCMLILPISLHYSKRSQVEAMSYLSKQPDFKEFLVEDSGRDFEVMFPLFYSRHWKYGYRITSQTNKESYLKGLQNAAPESKPNYVLFLQEENLEKRIAEVKKYFPDLVYEATIEPSFIDKVLHTLNPRNRNEVCFIYKTND